MRKNSVLRRVLLPLALVLALFSIGTSAAQAWNLTEVKYGPWGLQPGAGIGAGNPWRTDITGNIAIYEGAGTVSVCQRTYDFDADKYREGCGNNAVGNALNLTPYYGHFLFPGIKNNSPWYHTIRGVYYYGTP